VNIPIHPTNPTMMTWLTTAQGDDLDDALERATHQALREFCECHLPVLGDTAITLLPVRNEGNAVWSERMTTVGNRGFKADDLDDTRTQLQHAQDEVTIAQSYIHHLETELHERDEQLEASQAHAVDLQHVVEHLQELIPQEPEEPEEDPEEIEGISSVEDN
jgi:hypothetical protein